jgi:uncharacterized protein
MLIGVLSDSHGRAEVTRQAVHVLRQAGAETLLHLGDVETEAVIDELVGHNARLVFGNCDEERRLARYAQIMGISVDHPIGMIEAAGRQIAFTHGHLPHLMTQAMANGVDYLFHGHTHEVRDERVRGVRIINPGALHRARRYTAALLDPAADRLEIVEIPKPERP